MRARLVSAVLSLVIGAAFGDGVKEANELIKKSKRSDVEVVDVLELVKGDLTEEGVEKVLEWVIDNGFAEDRKKVGALLGNVPKNEKLMLKYVRTLGFYGEREQLASVIGSLEKGRVEQEARFRLALAVAEDAQRNLTLTDAERAKGNKEVLEILETLGKEEGLDEILQRWIKDLRYKVTHLVVGCEAPEIEGVDHEGKKFKLSGYRGKVVLMPFWGMW